MSADQNDRPAGGFELRRPCKLCPFRKDEGGIRFYTETRAMEIALSALYHGFPCHQTARWMETAEDDDQHGVYTFGPDSQHCAGFLIMKLHEDPRLPWPGIGDNDAILQQIRENLDMDAPVFRSTHDFISASGTGEPIMESSPERTAARSGRPNDGGTEHGTGSRDHDAGNRHDAEPGRPAESPTPADARQPTALRRG